MGISYPFVCSYFIPLYNFAKMNRKGGAGLRGHGHLRFVPPLGAYPHETYPVDIFSAFYVTVNLPPRNLPHQDFLEFIFLKSILGHGLHIMVMLTKRLPVIFVPEELRITSVRNDVVNNRSLDVSSFFQAPHTKDVLWI